MSADVQKIEYAALQHDISKLNQECYKDDVAIQELSRQIQGLNDKIDDIMLVLENITNSTPTYKEAASLWQIV